MKNITRILNEWACVAVYIIRVEYCTFSFRSEMTEATSAMTFAEETFQLLFFLYISICTKKKNKQVSFKNSGQQKWKKKFDEYIRKCQQIQDEYFYTTVSRKQFTSQGMIILHFILINILHTIININFFILIKNGFMNLNKFLNSQFK